MWFVLDASKVVPIDKLSVVITLVLAFVFLHEDFTITKITIIKFFYFFG